MLFWKKVLLQYAEMQKLRIGKYSGTLVCHLLQDLKDPGSNLDKD